MMPALRLLLVSLLAVLVSSGLIGCAVFSGAAQGVPAVQDVDKPVMAMMHDHHGAHGMAGTPVSAPSHDHRDDGCDSCVQTLLNRVSLTPDAGLAPNEVPAPVFIVPAALQLDPEPVLQVRDQWPPGEEAPVRAPTLTEQNISLLI